jgi:hypothetical protein
MSLATHVKDLAAANGIKLRFNEHARPIAYLATFTVRTWPITHDSIPIELIKQPVRLLLALPDLSDQTNIEVRTAVALHEYGHLITDIPANHRWYRELYAWNWARKHALYWSPAMEATRRYSLQSYAWRRPRVPAAFPIKEAA